MGKPAATDRPPLLSLSHSFTLDWDAHLAYVQPRPPDYPLDLVARTWGYDLRMAIYHLML